MREREKDREGERERERESSRRGGLNLISEKRVDTATAGSDRVIRTTLSLPVLRVTYRTCIKPLRVAAERDRQAEGY